MASSMKDLDVALKTEFIGALSEVAQVSSAGPSFTAFISSLTSNEDSTPCILAAHTAVSCLDSNQALRVTHQARKAHVFPRDLPLFFTCWGEQTQL